MLSSLPSTLSESQQNAFWREVAQLYPQGDVEALLEMADRLAPSDVHALVHAALTQDECWAEKHLGLYIVHEFNQLHPGEAQTEAERRQVEQWLNTVAQDRPGYLRYALAAHLCQVNNFRAWGTVLLESLPDRERMALMRLPYLWPASVEEAQQFEPLYALLDATQRLALAPKVFTDAAHTGDPHLLPRTLDRVRSWGYEPTGSDWSKVLFETFLDQRPWHSSLVEAHADQVGATAVRYVEAEEPEYGDRSATLHASDVELGELLTTMKTAHLRTCEQAAHPGDPEDFEFPLTTHRLLALQRRQQAQDAPVGDQPRRPRVRA